jgi:hypothetical protein
MVIIYQLIYKNNIITNEILQNMFSLSSIIIELENNYNGLLSRSSSEYSIDNLEINLVIQEVLLMKHV